MSAIGFDERDGSPCSEVCEVIHMGYAIVVGCMAATPSSGETPLPSLRRVLRLWTMTVCKGEYRVTHQVVPLVLLASNQKLRFSYATYRILKGYFCFDVDKNVGTT